MHKDLSQGTHVVLPAGRLPAFLTCAVMPQTVFRAIDKILANAAAAGLKVIVVPINNWQEVDGVPTYLQVPTCTSPYHNVDRLVLGFVGLHQVCQQNKEQAP